MTGLWSAWGCCCSKKPRMKEEKLVPREGDALIGPNASVCTCCFFWWCQVGVTCKKERIVLEQIFLFSMTSRIIVLSTVDRTSYRSEHTTLYLLIFFPSLKTRTQNLFTSDDIDLTSNLPVGFLLHLSFLPVASHAEHTM